MLKHLVKAVALYLRVSSTKQKEEGSSLRTQEERLRDLAARDGWTVYDVYWDDETGADRDRKDLERLLRDAMAGKFQAVLVYDIDRLARDNIYFLTLYKETLPRMGVQVLSYCQPADPTTPEGRLMYDIHASLAEYERHKIRERCLRGRVQKNKEGKFTGGNLPYAVAWDKAEKKFRLVPEEAVVYRQIFDLFIDEHLSYTEIARRLTEEGHLTRKLVGRKGLSRGGVPFTDRRIRFLIESTAAYGEWNRGRLLCRKLKDSARKRNFNSPIYWERKVRRREDWVPIPVPAVVTKERWERAQEIVRTRVRPARNVEAATLLQGFLFCAHCGSRVGPEWPRGKKPGAEARYRCMTQPYSTDRRYRRYQGMSCALPRLRQPDLDRVVWAKVEEWISNPETLWEAAYERGRGARDEAEEKIAGLRKRLTAAKVQEERAARLFTMGVAPETAQGQVREAAARRLAAQKELEVAERAVWAARSREEDRNYAFAVLNAYRGQLGALTLAEKREVLRVLVPAGPEYKIEVAKTGDISITGAIPAEKCVSVPSTPYTAASYET